MHQPSVEDRPAAAPDTPPEGRMLGCTPVPRASLLLDREHHTLQAQADGRDMLLDGNQATHVNAEGHHHGGCQCSRRESQTAAVQQSDEGGRRHLRTAEVQEDAIPTKNKSL